MALRVIFGMIIRVSFGVRVVASGEAADAAVLVTCLSPSLSFSRPRFLCALEGDGEWFRVHGSGFSDKL